MFNLLTRRQLGMLAASLALVGGMVQAETFPTKPMTMVVPFAAGAATDRAARSIAKQLEKQLGQPLVVENVAGASGTLGAKRLLRSQADGYTIMLGTINDLVIGQAVMKPGYTLDDFTPLARTGMDMTVLVAHPSFPAQNADELVKLARAAATPLQIGVPGQATMQTYGANLLADAGDFKIQTVPYKAGAPLITDLLGGQIQIGTIALSSVLPQIRGGKLKAIGVLSDRRHASAPEIPTVNEGKLLKGVNADLWVAVVAPKGLSAAVSQRFGEALGKILADPVFRADELRAGFMIPDIQTPAQTSQFMAQEHRRLKKLIDNTKLD
jgi:tripartite-type tricarboxylate transporter receptor subunit TctC